MGVFDSLNIKSLQFLPPLPNLDQLRVENCTDFKDFVFPAQSLSGLRSLILNSNNLDDTLTEKILTSVAVSPSAFSLSILYLEDNRLNEVPNAVRSLPQLTDLYLIENNITFIGKGALFFSAPWVTEINLVNNSLNAIEAGAFQGNKFICCLYPLIHTIV